MDERIEKANRALFEGNRSEVLRQVGDRASTVQELWLKASSLEDAGDRKRVLQHIASTRETPYARMANEILAREHDFETQMQQAPRWQTWLLEKRPAIIKTIITLTVLCGVAILGIQFIFPEEEPLAGEFVQATATADMATQFRGATQTVIALTPTSTPTVTPMAMVARVEYWPVGALRVLNIENPTARPVTLRSNQAVTAPAGSSFVAIRYEFTCGAGQAFCDAPPQALVLLQPADSSQTPIPYEGYSLLGVPSPASIAQGQTTVGWLVFRVPDNFVLHSLVIQPGDGRQTVAQGTPTPTPVPTLALPR